MDEGRDALLVFVASVLLVLLIAGQVVLLAAHLWVPMAGAADWLLNADEAEGEPTGAPGDAPPGARPGWWLWAAIGSAVVGAGLVVLAAVMLRGGYTLEQRRWRWVVALGGLATVWGLLVAWMIGRSAEMFSKVFWGAG